MNQMERFMGGGALIIGLRGKCSHSLPRSCAAARENLPLLNARRQKQDAQLSVASLLWMFSAE